MKTTKLGWLTKSIARLAKVTSTETITSFKKGLTVAAYTLKAHTKMKATVQQNLTDQGYGAGVSGPEHVVDEENYVEFSRCRRTYIGIKEKKLHWGHSQEEHHFNESTDVIY